MKNFNQKGSKNSIAKEKRYSKSKFKNEAKAENSVQKTKFVAKKKATNKADNLSDFYRNKYEERVNKSSLTFRGIGKLRTVILKATTKQFKGFSVLSKGQCVVVEGQISSNVESLNNLLQVRTQDGRVGLVDPNYVNSLNFAV